MDVEVRLFSSREGGREERKGKEERIEWEREVEGRREWEREVEILYTQRTKSLT